MPVVDFVGPFEEWRVVVDGWQVPLLTAQPQKGGQVSLSLDDRFGLDLSVSDAERVVPFIAHAIAIASGLACHPRDDDELVPITHPRPVRTRRVDLS